MENNNLGVFFTEGVGGLLCIQTNLGEEVEGRVFATDEVTGTLVLKQEGLYGACTLRLVPMDHIANVVRFEKGTAPVEPLPKVDAARAKMREEEAVRKVEEALHKIGVGVSREAQNIFDALDKTMPCRWDGKDIIVLDEIRIRAPYTAESCKMINEQPHAHKVGLERVKLVLQNELERLQGKA